MIGDGELSELYQELILDHNARPRNFGALPGATHHAKGHNPLCGDQLEVELVLDGGQIRDVRFVGQGCAISKASASLMTDSLKGKSTADAQRLFDAFHALVTSDQPPAAPVELGKLAVFTGVCEFPMRVKCATLAWHTLKAALAGGTDVSTE